MAYVKNFRNPFKAPGYHFTPPSGWMNDPNGLIHISGEYHIFYQYNPDNPFGPLLNRIRWGHAKSADLVSWEHLPAALVPDMPYDRGGAWSGCMVNDGGVATALYTGISGDIFKRQTQCIATSEDMIRWKKDGRNPVIKKPPVGVNPWCFRDPYVWKHEGEWLMVLGAARRGRGAILLYRSPDLREWKYSGPLLTGDSRHGRVWECPNFFRLGDKWVLIISAIPWKTIYFTGEFDGRKFYPESEGKVDHGSCFYAPQVFKDDAGRCIMFGWLREETPLAAVSGRQGAQSLPRVISLGDDNRLVFEPAPEVEKLRVGEPDPLDVRMGRDTPFHVETETGDTFEIIMVLKRAGSSKIVVSSDADNIEIGFDRREYGLVIKRPGASGKRIVMPVAGNDAEPVRFRMFADRSIVEIYAGGSCASFRVYPFMKPQKMLRISDDDGMISSGDFGVWKLQSSD